MIVVNVNAGLANQMFHYAFGRSLIAKGYDVYFDQSNFKHRKSLSSKATFEDIRLQEVFPNIELKEMPRGHFKWVFPQEPTSSNFLKKKLYTARNRFMIKFHNFIGDENYIMEPSYGYCNNIEKKITSNCIFRGFWQSEKYFLHCEADIRKQFCFPPFDEEMNIKISEKMKNENSVAIHLRKGKDYLSSPLTGHGLCGVDYYMNAIKYIKKNVENPVFYVFTDNPTWLKDNLPQFNYTLVDWNEIVGKKNYRDMQLMSCCKHNIIANSTYSWWGAWLNSNPSKIVISPSIFFNPINDFFSSSDIICEDWVKI